MFGIFKDIGSEIVPIFGMCFAAFYLYLVYKEKQERNKEKIALIEKGLDPSLIDAKSESQQKRNRQSSLKIGLMLICIALGVLFGYMLNSTLFVPNFVAYSTSILVFCGILLVYFHKSKTE